MCQHRLIFQLNTEIYTSFSVENLWLLELSNKSIFCSSHRATGTATGSQSSSFYPPVTDISSGIIQVQPIPATTQTQLPETMQHYEEIIKIPHCDKPGFRGTENELRGSPFHLLHITELTRKRKRNQKEPPQTLLNKKLTLNRNNGFFWVCSIFKNVGLVQKLTIEMKLLFTVKPHLHRQR